MRSKLKHKKSPSFSITHATGAVLSSSQESFQLTFYADSINIKSESIENGELYIKDDDWEDFREDKVSISLSHETLVKLRNLINERL